MARAEAERDTAHHDALMARMDVDAAENAKVEEEFKLALVQNTLVVVEEARQKAEDKASRLANKRVYLQLELGTL